MTRIRKKWSSSQSAEDPTTLRSREVVAHDSQTEKTDGRHASHSPILPQIVNEDAYNLNLLISVALNLEHDNGGLCNVKHGNSSPKVMKSESPEVVNQPYACLRGERVINQRRKAQWFENMPAGPIRLWLEGIAANDGPVAMTYASTKREVDEVPSKSSSFTMRNDETQDAQNLATAKPVQGFVSQLMEVHSDIRQELWEIELDPSPIGGDCEARQKGKNQINSEGDDIGNANTSTAKNLQNTQLEALPMTDFFSSDIDDSNDKKRQHVDSQDGGIDMGVRSNLRVKPTNTESIGDQVEAQSAKDRFPKGWKWRGLAEIAEREEGTHNQVEERYRCSRTDGHRWRCPLRAEEGASLCEHHTIKAREKMLRQSSCRKKKSEKD